MMIKKPVVIYGASGYTGRLVAEYLREYQLPFIAAGRNPEAIQAAMDKVPGIETAEYEVRKVDHSLESLVELFKGAKVICNTVGPFARFGTVTVQAALEAGCHYIDTTGEQEWMLDMRDEFGAAYAEKGLLLAPSTAYMHALGNIALHHTKLDHLGLHSGLNHSQPNHPTEPDQRQASKRQRSAARQRRGSGAGPRGPLSAQAHDRRRGELPSSHGEDRTREGIRDLRHPQREDQHPGHRRCPHGAFTAA